MITSSSSVKATVNAAATEAQKTAVQNLRTRSAPRARRADDTSRAAASSRHSAQIVHNSASTMAFASRDTFTSPSAAHAPLAAESASSTTLTHVSAKGEGPPRLRHAPPTAPKVAANAG